MSLEVSSDACTGRDSQYFFLRFHFNFFLVIYHICVLVCLLPINISMEENLSCELA